MKTKHIIGIVALLGVAGLITGLAIHFKKQAKLLAEYCTKVVGGRIKKLSLAEVAVEIDVAVKNKSKIDVTITGYDLFVSVNNRKVSALKKAQTTQQLPAEKESIISLAFSFVPAEVIRGAITKDVISGVIVDKSKVIISIAGFVSVAHKNLKVENFPVNITMSLAEMLKPSTTEC